MGFPMSRKLAVITIAFDDKEDHIGDTSDLAVAVEASLLNSGLEGVDVTVYSNPFALQDNIAGGYDVFSSASQADSMSVPGAKSFTVEGSGEFPRDMLRYDDAVPADELSAKFVNAKLGDPLLEANRAGEQHLRTYQVHLVSVKEDHHVPGPATARWESFGFRVIRIGDAFLGSTSQQMKLDSEAAATPRI